MAALATTKSLARGTRVKLTDASITTTGTIDFDVPYDGGGDFSALFQVVGTLASFSADLQVSLDGGTTFNNLASAFLVAATPFKVQTPLITGARYRLNFTAGPTSADVYVVRN